MKLIQTCAQEKNREALYMMYLVYLPFMTKETKMTFKEFHDQATVRHSMLDVRPKDEIMERIMQIGRKDA